MRPLLVGAAIISLGGCGSPTEATSSELVVHAAAPVLELTNHSSAPIYSFTVDRVAAAVIDWAPCTNPVTCGAISPGGTDSLSYTQIAGYSSASKEAIVYWWHLVPDGKNGFRLDSLRSVITAL